MTGEVFLDLRARTPLMRRGSGPDEQKAMRGRRKCEGLFLKFPKENALLFAQTVLSMDRSYHVQDIMSLRSFPGSRPCMPGELCASLNSTIHTVVFIIRPDHSSPERRCFP